MKEIRIAYVPRLDTFEYQLVKVKDGKVSPITDWKSGGRTLEAAKTAAVAQYGNLTITVS